MHVLSISSLKGGVGKTTVTLGLASAAFAKGLRTLVVDLDPQSDASTGMDIEIEGRLNVADVLTNPKDKVVQQAISPSGWTQGHGGTIDVLIGSPSAINFDGPHPTIKDIWKLETALTTVENDYDLVLVDCAPSLNALTRTAWAPDSTGRGCAGRPRPAAPTRPPRTPPRAPPASRAGCRAARAA